MKLLEKLLLKFKRKKEQDVKIERTKPDEIDVRKSVPIDDLLVGKIKVKDSSVDIYNFTDVEDLSETEWKNLELKILRGNPEGEYCIKK
jgi:hypothetical protein